MSRYRLAPAPPALDSLTPLPPRKAPSYSASLAAVSPLASCGRRQSLVLPPLVPEGSEPPAYFPFCDQRCQASRGCWACPKGNGGDIETAQPRTIYEVAGGTPGRSHPEIDTLPLNTFTDISPTSKRTWDGASPLAGRKSVTFESPGSEIATTDNNSFAFENTITNPDPLGLVLAGSPRCDYSRFSTNSAQASQTADLTDTNSQSLSLQRISSARASKGAFVNRAWSSASSVGTYRGLEQRGLFPRSRDQAEDQDRYKAVGRCSLTQLVARFKDHAIADNGVEERMLDVVRTHSNEPRSELLYLKREKGDDLNDIKPLRFSRFVQPNYRMLDFDYVHTNHYMDSMRIHSQRKSNQLLRSSRSGYIRMSVAEHVTALFLGFYASILSVLTAATRPRKLATFVACCFIVSIFSFILFVVMGGNYWGDQFLLLRDPVLRGDPGYLVDFFGEKCVHLRSSFAGELRQLESLNLRLGWRAVTFNARDGRTVSALWLPSAMRQAPRVVIAHSGLSNFLESAVQTAAYYLRSSNISVLAPNLRHHGGNGRLERQVLRWQNQELDILGAWDYAVSDPEGLLGGPLDDHLVGLMGFDFGAFGVQLAYGLEPRIPSMFLDGAVTKLRELLRQKIDLRLSAWLVWMFDEQAWTEWKDLVHRDLDKELSTSILKDRAKPGFIAITHCKQDTFVPFAQSEMLVDELSNIALTGLMQWYPDFHGPSTCKRRSECYMEQPEEYKAFLCSFWSRVFDETASGDRISPRCRDFGLPPGLSS